MITELLVMFKGWDKSVLMKTALAVFCVFTKYTLYLKMFNSFAVVSSHITLPCVSVAVGPAIDQLFSFSGLNFEITMQIFISLNWIDIKIMSMEMRLNWYHVWPS